MRITLLWILTMLTLVGCKEAPFTPAAKTRLTQANVRFNHVGIVTDGMVKSTYSNDVSSDKLATKLRQAVTAELSEFQGENVYNIGVRVTSYMLANPSVPTASSPKSVLMLSVSVWNDSPEQKRVLAPATVIVVDGLFGTSVVITKPQGNTDQRLAALCAKAAIEIERFLERNVDIFALNLRELGPAVADLASVAADPVANVN